MPLDSKKSNSSKNILPSNPLHCWNMFVLYVTSALFSAAFILSLFIQLVTQFDPSAAVGRASVTESVQTIFIGISLIGFFIFLIKPFLNVLKHIFEDISEKESFSKNVKTLLRCQWFLLFFHIAILCSRELGHTNVVCLSLVFLNFLFDLYNFNMHFTQKNVEYASYLSYLICLITMFFTGDIYLNIAFIVIKLTLNYTLKKLKTFLNFVVEENLYKKLRLLHLLTIVNVYMFCFVFLENYSNFVSVDVDNMMFRSLGNLMYMLFVPNITKMVTWFM